MADEEDIAALVIDNGSGMCKGKFATMWYAVKDPMAATRGSESCPGRRNAGTSWGGIAGNQSTKLSGTIWFWLRWEAHAHAPTAVIILRTHCAAMVVGNLPRKRERTIQQPLRPASRSRGVAVYRSKIGIKTEHSKVFRSVEKFIFPPLIIPPKMPTQANKPTSNSPNPPTLLLLLPLSPRR